MSSSSSGGGLGIGTIVFWVIMANVFFFNDDDEDTEVVEDNTPSIVEQVAEDVNQLREVVKDGAYVVKGEIKEFRDKVAIERENTEEANEHTTEKANESPKPKDDPDDLYGSSEDKY